MNVASPTRPDIDVATRDLCLTCQHPTSAHDAIGTRWCAATKLGVGRRECICSGVVAQSRALTHY